MKKYYSAKDLEMYFDSVYSRVKRNDEVYNFFNSSLEEEFLPKKQFFSTIQPFFVKKAGYGFEYDSPSGLLDLRLTIAERYFGNKKSATDIVITAGGQEGLYLAINYLARKKRELTVAVEESVYVGFRQIMEQFNCRLVEIPLEKNGLDVKFLENSLRSNNIDVLYIIPDLQNPTSVTLSQGKRVKLKKLQQKYDFHIIADLAYRDLYYNENDKKSIKSFTDPKNFIIGTFSKTIFPSLRIGWLYFPHDIQAIVLAKRSINLFQPSFLQVSLNEFLKRDYDNYLKLIKYMLIQKKKYLQFLLRNFQLNKYFTWSNPNGSYYLWVKAKPKVEINIDEFISQNIIVAPGTFFNPKNGKKYFRLCFSKLSSLQLLNSISTISKIYGEDVESLRNRELLTRTIMVLFNIKAKLLTQRLVNRLIGNN
jgi:DNA-binding transcriptional MocR family regulator